MPANAGIQVRLPCGMNSPRQVRAHRHHHAWRSPARAGAKSQRQPNGHRAATREVIVSYADEVPYDAVCKIVRNNVGRLPVVNRQNPRRIVGYLGRSNLMAGRLRYFEDKYVRERRFLGRAVAAPNNFAARLVSPGGESGD